MKRLERWLPDSLKSQFVTLNESGNKRSLHLKELPYVFTELALRTE